VWMPPNEWLKQNGPPRTVAPLASVADPQLLRSSLSRPTNMYSALMLQLAAKAHSTPPPTVQVVITLPAMTAPIGVSKGVTAVLPVDGGEIVQIRAARGYRGGFTEAPLFGGEAPFIEGERWLDGEQW
jgi:hypothetical protein